MARFNPSAHRGTRGGRPGSGLGGLARRDHQRELRERQALKATPVTVDGVQYLGWGTMPPKVRRQFLAGQVAYKVVRRLS